MKNGPSEKPNCRSSKSSPLSRENRCLRICYYLYRVHVTSLPCLWNKFTICAWYKFTMFMLQVYRVHVKSLPCSCYQVYHVHATSLPCSCYKSTMCAFYKFSMCTLQVYHGHVESFFVDMLLQCVNTCKNKALFNKKRNKNLCFVHHVLCFDMLAILFDWNVSHMHYIVLVCFCLHVQPFKQMQVQKTRGTQERERGDFKRHEQSCQDASQNCIFPHVEKHALTSDVVKILCC